MYLLGLSISLIITTNDLPLFPSTTPVLPWILLGNMGCKASSRTTQTISPLFKFLKYSLCFIFPLSLRLFRLLIKYSELIGLKNYPPYPHSIFHYLLILSLSNLLEDLHLIESYLQGRHFLLHSPYLLRLYQTSFYPKLQHHIFRRNQLHFRPW